MHANSPMPDFKCVICQVECQTCPADGGWAFCEEHCPDHQYEYDPGERKSLCIDCGAERPDDWSFDDDVI